MEVRVKGTPEELDEFFGEKVVRKIFYDDLAYFRINKFLFRVVPGSIVTNLGRKTTMTFEMEKYIEPKKEIFTP